MCNTKHVLLNSSAHFLMCVINVNTHSGNNCGVLLTSNEVICM